MNWFGIENGKLLQEFKSRVIPPMSIKPWEPIAGTGPLFKQNRFSWIYLIAFIQGITR